MMSGKQYTTKRNKWELAALFLSILFLLAMIGLNLFVKGEEDEYVTFPMVNQKITWEGAGYSGVYGRD